MNILVPNSKFCERKNPCKLAFQTSRLQMSPIPQATPSLLVLVITFALLCSTVHAVPNDREDKRNVGNHKDGNEQHHS